VPQETMDKFPIFDFGAIGEAEIMFGELVDWFNGKKDLHNIDAITFRENNELIINSKKNLPMDLDDLPFPSWHLFPKAKGYHIITARGCPYQCVFCMSPYGRDLTRERSPQNSIKEMEMTINAYNPEYYKFNDETFGLNRKRSLDILDLIISKGLHKVPKIASMRGNLVDPELLSKMKEAGFDYIDYGVETGDPEILKIIKKGVTLEQTRRAVHMTKEAGIRVGTNFILGHPHDTMTTMNRTLDYAASLNPDVIAIGIMVPYPGTEVAEIVKRGEGGYKLLSTDWSDYNKQLGNAVELVDVSRRQLESLQLKGYTMTYLRNKRYVDFAKFCFTYRRSALAFAKNFVKKKYSNNLNEDNGSKTVEGGFSEGAIRGKNFWSGTPS
jgi:anaerobic magnesium-protoporphyrin IX monomethyl ester cyclase